MNATHYAGYIWQSKLCAWLYGPMYVWGKFLFSDYSITTIFAAFQYIFYMQVRLLFQIGAEWDSQCGEGNVSKFNSLTCQVITGQFLNFLQFHIREFIAPQQFSSIYPGVQSKSPPGWRLKFWFINILLYTYIHIKNMKIVFQFNIAIEGDLNQNFRIQCPKQLLYHFCIGLFKIHFYTDVVGCLLARSLRIHIQIFSFVKNNSLFQFLQDLQ
jgi:hypothetical protein